METRINPETRPQAGGALLSAVATAGVVMVLVQGSLFYKAREGAKFMSSEKGKIAASQMAEAGVEDNIAELGGRELLLTPYMEDYVTFQGKPLGSGSYTTWLSVRGMGAEGDTVELVSNGSSGGRTATIQARLKVQHLLDSNLTPLLVVEPETTYTYSTTTVYDTTVVTTVQNPNDMPALDKTDAYDACMGSGSKKCDVCHLPGGDVTKADVVSVAKPSIHFHMGCHGDYVTTDGTCDIYKPKKTRVVSTRNVIDTVMTVTDKSTYDTVMVIDTLTTVKILSWR